MAIDALTIEPLDTVLELGFDRPEIVDPDVVGLRQIELRLLRRNAEREILHHLAVCGPGDVLLIIVAHGGNRLQPSIGDR